MANLTTMRVELTSAAKTCLSEMSDQAGMTQIKMLSRMIEWFARQPESIQATVLGHFPAEIAPEIARLMLRKMSARKQ